MKSTRKTLTEPRDWWLAFEIQSALNGESLSGFAGECMLANLDDDLREGLSERPSVGKPKSDANR